ncbi:probable RNA helicase armi [Galleria mellonella]|uniref:RNA helicase n=1 Tax=Galleria mellonella TaxID=7137 RepID=A0A6J3C808_GALME|nr:probable RNA helicase armi [Galleria mellonella]XP_031768831.2 probable RNA helicase armi [Galleria mellonella]XP_031768832.2 probable RNA helicase armi [Galleria mellonella]
MISYLLSFFKFFFNNNSEEDDTKKEDFLAEELLNLEIQYENSRSEIKVTEQEIPRNAVCFQRTGIITYIGENNYVLIDGMLYYELVNCTLNLNVNDKILYLCYKDSNDAIVVVRILENMGVSWTDDNEVEENSFKVIEHILVGEVDYRQDRFVYIKDNDLKFSLDNVEGTMIPIKGDWLEMKCTVQWDEDKPSDISVAQVLEVISFRPLRTKVKSATITQWSDDSGTCDRQIYFNRHCLQNGEEPKVGYKVMVEAIESNQGLCSWRAIKMAILDNNVNDPVVLKTDNDVNLNLEKEKNLDITYPLQFDKVSFHETASIILNITNNSNETYTFNKWIILSKKRDSQVNIKPYLSRPENVYPGQTFKLTVICNPKFLGKTNECLVMLFRGFQVKRFIEINIVDNNVSSTLNGISYTNFKPGNDRLAIMKEMRKKSNESFIPGVRPVKPPAFVPVRVGNFPIPDKVWCAVLGDSDQTIYSSDYKTILNRIESDFFPCLSQELNINNYIDKWHTLLYMEEVQANINMRAYDMPKAFLIQSQEYLSLEIKGLAERRPSLVKGDRVIVKDIWNDSAPQFEGYIHLVKNDMILMKFHQQFHETYSGSDVSVEFHLNRSVFRRSHQAINLAISNLGPDILFPSRVLPHSHQLPLDKIKTMNWFNENLNVRQKAAVTNILLGECRPLPYCIYGPPGTGKTITVIETILQILTLLPDSRILVATPSNSAANLITERLVEYKNVLPNSIIRLIANYLLDSDNIPDSIKPYCATLDIARENTAKSKHIVKDGVNINCSTSYIGRHRVTIGTCCCLGTLAQMGLPKGHFTHIIIDEAGQATEPEIMIPMTFIDKDSGQIILAGDPMQLGPVILSKYCQEFNMDESYLSRILETFPYQKDYDAYENGFDYRLVTKLNDNYRSLKEVLTLPSEMFYDASLVPRIERNQQWITKILNVTSEIFDTSNDKSGGIYVYGIRGENLRAADSPSWYNPHEASMVALITCKLYKNKVVPDEIGIITPYIAQIKHLRHLFEAMGVQQPKIGTVEEFQGQERPIILISTVRSSASYISEDIKHTLGFIKNPKRVNVSLTRAQIAVLLFCDPHVLSKDHLWNRVILQAVNEDKYMGCDLPFKFNKINTV